MFRFLRTFALFFVAFLSFDGTLFAAGFTCDAAKTYVSCDAGYYLSDCGSYRDGRTIASPAAGNSCEACPAATSSAYYECAGGAVCPKNMVENEFTIKINVPSAGTVFGFNTSAAGVFYVKWGDSSAVQKIDRTSNTTDTMYSHTYTSTGTKTITISGQATNYNDTNYSMPAITFYSGSTEAAKRENTAMITEVSGSLGSVFGTLSSGQNPRFPNLFTYATNLKTVPSTLFSGITGFATGNMFGGAFQNTGLTSIPSNLFAGVSGNIQPYTFSATFLGCTGLTSIPENLFGNITGTMQRYAFTNMFNGCTNLSGPSAKINGEFIYNIWPDATSEQVGSMYYNATGLSDYRCIPTAWGGGGEDCPVPTAEFTLTTTPDTTSFNFSISAAGEFYVDWGDGTVETIIKADTTNTTYTHDYATVGAYTIGIGGQATAYNTSTTTAAISFSSDFNAVPSKIASIDGSLGAIFGTLSSGTQKQPRFYQTFSRATNMTGSIPSDLFAGISGAPASYMFYGTFRGCSGLTSIPSDLFAGISGAPASSMFTYTFSGCSGLTGAIPDGLFAGISGAPASNMFQSTFFGCSGLTSIPENLFAGISGAPASSMFDGTFSGCSGLTSIPENLFAGISGAPATGMFVHTFLGCSGLTSIPENLFAGISGAPAPLMFSRTFRDCSGLTSIPAGLFAGISGAPASYMFQETFRDCSGLTSIPDGLFAGISGAPARSMFSGTFYGCSKLTSIPENLFGNISGPAQSYMFTSTFYNCTSLTGSSAKINGEFIYNIWPSATTTQVGDMYTGATGLDDYPCIPANYGGTGNGCIYITYNANGGSGTAPTSPTYCVIGGTCVVPENTFTRTGYNFSNWTANTDSVSIGTFAPGADIFSGYSESELKSWGGIELTAKWTANCNRVYLNPTSGTAGALSALYKITDSPDVWYTDPLCSEPINQATFEALVPTRSGYTFRGFYARENSTEYESDIVADYLTTAQYLLADGYASPIWNVNGRTTLYASWVKDCEVPANGKCRMSIGPDGLTVDYTAACETGYTVGDANTATPTCTANTYTCSAGQYLNGDSCATCMSGSYCTGGSYTYNGQIQGQSACPSGYDDSDAGSVAQTACYLMTEAGKYVATAQGALTDCPAGDYCTGGVKVNYGSIGGSTPCPDGYRNGAAGYSAESQCLMTVLAGKYVGAENSSTLSTCAAGTAKAAHTVAYGSTSSCDVCGANQYSDAGAGVCESCATENGYGNSGDVAENHAGAASCKTECGPGTWVATAGGGCEDVGAGYYGAGGIVPHGSISANRGQCVAPLTTIGYGFGANEADDCGRKLHAGSEVIYLRSAPRTSPALNVKVGDDIFYGAMSTALTGKLKVKDVDNTTYSVVNDYQ